MTESDFRQGLAAHLTAYIEDEAPNAFALLAALASPLTVTFASVLVANHVFPDEVERHLDWFCQILRDAALHPATDYDVARARITDVYQEIQRNALAAAASRGRRRRAL